MRALSSMLLTLSLALTWAAPSLAADEKPAKKDGSEKDGGDKKKEKKDGKEAKVGTKGVPPYMEKILKGHKLVSARDFAGAVEAYRSAIAEDDKNPLGHYLVGGAQLLKGDLAEAEAAWQNALRVAGNDAIISAKVRFALADLRERQLKFDDSKTAWQDYGKFVADHPKANGYPNTPPERQKVINTHQDLEKKYGEVKARIAAREKELKEKRDSEAAKDAAEEEKKGGKKKLAGPSAL